MTDAAEDLLSELDLGAAPSGPPVTKEPLYIRDLTADDIKSLSTRATYGSQPSQLIQKLRAPHHTLARLLAEGKKHPECSIVTGYTVEYIVMLERDPAFQELVAYYREQITPIYLNVHERLATLGAMAMEIIQERMSDSEKVNTMTTGQLREIMNDALDRSVAPSKVMQGAGGFNGGQPAPAINIQFVSAPAIPATVPPPLAIKDRAHQPPMLELSPERRDD